MEADYDNLEIARVIHGYKLVDSESYERQYARPDGLPLVPGYYVVYWSEGIIVRRFNEAASFYGPFRLRQEARDFLERLRAEPAIASIPANEFGGPYPITSRNFMPTVDTKSPAVRPSATAPA